MSAPTVSPETAKAKASLTDIFMKNGYITGYCLEVQKFQLTALPRETEWHKNFKSALATAQHHGSYWISELGPALFSEVPASIIDYGNLFTAASGEVDRILTGMGSQKPTPAEKEALHGIFSAILQELKEKQEKIKNLQERLKTFNQEMAGDYRAISTTRDAAVKETGLSKANQDAIEREIDSLKAEIKAANTKQAVSAIALGVSLFVLVAAIGFAFATAGATAPLVVGAVAIVGVAAGTTCLVVYTSEINDKIKAMQRKLGELSEEQRMVAALGMVSGSLDALAKDCDKAIDALADVLNRWAVLASKIESVINDINKADAATLRSLISTYMRTSCTSWGQLVDYATLLQRCAAQPEIKDVTHESAKPAKAA